jgi:hypothetical protein
MVAHLTTTISTYHRCNPFPVPRLDTFQLIASIGASYNYTSCNHAYHKARFVEVVNIGIDYTMFSLVISYNVELLAYKLRIFAQRSLVVVYTIPVHLKLLIPLYKSICPVLADPAMPLQP